MSVIAGAAAKRSWRSMMKVAVLETGGKQFVAREGEAIEVDRIPATVGESVELKDVLLVVDGPEIRVGTPLVDGAAVEARVVDHIRGPKILVFKYIPKERYRKRRGHRQMLTRLAIERIRFPGEGAGAKAAEVSAPAKKKAPAKVAKAAAKKAPARKAPAKKTVKK
jgi:large subunit ribosomal protein L21